jgi:hypothetical protein
LKIAQKAQGVYLLRRLNASGKQSVEKISASPIGTIYNWEKPTQF